MLQPRSGTFLQLAQYRGASLGFACAGMMCEAILIKEPTAAGCASCRGEETRDGEITLSPHQQSLLLLAAEVMMLTQEADQLHGAEDLAVDDDMPRAAKRRKVLVALSMSTAAT